LIWSVSSGGLISEYVSLKSSFYPV